MDTITIDGLGTFSVDTDRGLIWQEGRTARYSDKEARRIYRAAEKAFPDAIADEWLMVDDKD